MRRIRVNTGATYSITFIQKNYCRGFGYIEFSTRQASQEAIAGMNMFDLGGQFLRVSKQYCLLL